MKLKFFPFIFLLSYMVCYGQNKDSLLNVIKNYKFNDTIQCERYKLLIFLENDKEIWIKYNTILGKICEQKINSKIGEQEKRKYYHYYGDYYNTIGFYYSELSDFEQAIFNYKQAIIYAKKSGRNSELGQTLSNIGLSYVKKGESQKYLEYHNKALNAYKQIGDSIGISKLYADLGYQYAENGAEVKAMEYFIKSFKISDAVKDKDSKIRTMEYMVKTLKNQKEYNKALEYSNELVKYFKEAGKNESLALIYFSMASTYNSLGNYKEMFYYTSKSIEISKTIDAPNSIAANYGLLAKHFLSKKQIEKAYVYSKLEIENREKSIKEPAFTKSLIRYVEILNLKKQTTDAEKIGKKTYENAQLLENPELIMQSARNLKSIYTELNQKSKALDFAEIEIKMKDSLNSMNTQNSAIKSIFKYETEKKEAQIKALSQQKKITELQNKQQKTGLLLLGLAVLSISISGFLIFKRYKAKKQTELLKSKIEKTIAESKATESELKALKSQMNPHFIFNALNSIQEQFMFGDKLVANEQMGNFTSLTRQILSVSGKKKIPLSLEVDILTKYLELEKMRFETNFEYDIQLNENIDDEYVELPPMLIQPFIENSIKHGLLHKDGAKKIEIYFTLNEEETHLLCTVQDNGVGRKKAESIKQKNQHNSFSTGSIAQRLQMINNNQEDNLVYEDLEDLVGNALGTKVILKIQL